MNRADAHGHLTKEADELSGAFAYNADVTIGGPNGTGLTSFLRR